ncbi:MAG TPA: DUF58 domain-containing protein [Streptosporangiaceae bacterium]|nr:DUF58 domain-containing protein [Streptosporangiaceae bacterium]
MPDQPRAAAPAPAPAGAAAATAGPPDRAEPGAPATTLALSWKISGHARRLLTLAVAGLAVAVLTGRPEFAGLAAPALLLLAAGRGDRPAQLGVTTGLSTARLVEGERAAVTLAVRGTGSCTVHVALRPGHAIVPLPGPGGQRPGHATGQDATLPFTVRRWGRRRVGSAEIILRDRWRLAEGRAETGLPMLDCYPRPATERIRVVLSRLPQRLGEHTSRATGEGTEFGGVREYVPGDRQRSINWPATTRRGRLQVNTFQAERAQDVVILVDAAWDEGEPGDTVVDRALRGAAAAARAYLRAQDRVGFISYRYQARWLVPGLGERHYYRIAEAMLAQERDRSHDTGFTRLPRAALPPGALILVFSPLVDARLVETLRDLRQRGFAVLIVDVLAAEPWLGRGRTARLAHRLWRLEHQAIRFSLRELGVPVVQWDGQQSLDLPLAPYTRRTLVTHR